MGTKGLCLRICISLIICLAFTIGCTAESGQKPDSGRTPDAQASQVRESIKEPEFDGQFYPKTSPEITSMISSFLKKANPPESKDTLAALISPHAGYIYSGPVAAYGYKLLKGRTVKTVILIAPTHHYDFQGFAIYREGAFKTPLGEIPVNGGIASKIIEHCSLVKENKAPFEGEHSLEVQLPFLQAVSGGFTIVPLIAGRVDLDGCRELAETLKTVCVPGETLIVASSDMSHYHPAEVAEKMDKKTISHIEKLDAEGLLGELRRGNCELCGGIPVLVTLLLAKELSWKPADLRYAHSGDATGDRSKVVGYTSVAFYTQKDKEVEKVEQEAFLTGEEKKMLLTMVRQTLEEYLKTGKVPDFFKDKPVPEHLKMETGMFVTLHKNHMLRGCIGYITGREPLYKAVSDLAISSATRDPRFRPVKHEELKDIDIEISVMTPLKRITDPNEVVVGKHGVVVQKGFSSGVFLPQVATEQGWDRETFLTELCRGKAGLPGDAWKDKNTELYIFSADVFGEKE